jgi:hypothetical protein
LFKEYKERYNVFDEESINCKSNVLFKLRNTDMEKITENIFLFMNNRLHFFLKKEICLLLILFAVMGAYGEKKARVITESGKKWNVIFIKMSNDTIYLKVPKPNGAFFSISGHKSKFKKLEFSDGSTLDFALSNFPFVENPENVFDTVNNIDSASLVKQNSLSTIKDSNNNQHSDYYGEYSSPDSNFSFNTSDAAKSTKNDTASIFRLDNAEKPAGITPDTIKGIPSMKKKSHVLSFTFLSLSIASAASGAICYYQYKQDHKKAQDAFVKINQASIDGVEAEKLIEENRRQHDNEKSMLSMSEILFGTSAAFLSIGIVFYF